MNSEFEEYLSRQSVRPIPREWRAEILGSIQPRSVGAPPAPAPWWREWLWPCPQAWAGLVTGWLLIFLLHAAAPSGSNRATNAPPMSSQAYARLQLEMDMIAQLSDSPPPAAFVPKPRTCRRIKQNMG